MRAQTELEIRILDMVEPVARRLGLDVVRVRVMGRGTPVLQIMAERPDGGMDVEDCAAFSRALSPVLDAEDPIAGEYSLEVSSPGIDRPLTRAGDFGKWAGHEIKIELGVPVDGRKRFHGFIRAEGPQGVTVDLKDGGEAVLAVPDMVKAHLVLTDRLIRDAQARGQGPAALDGDDDFAAVEGGFDTIDVEDDDSMDADAEGDAEDDKEQ